MIIAKVRVESFRNKEEVSPLKGLEKPDILSDKAASCGTPIKPFVVPWPLLRA